MASVRDPAIAASGAPSHMRAIEITRFGSPEVLVAGDAAELAQAGLKLGDKVCALVAGGGYAELCVVPLGQCLPAPSGLSLIEAAALPETFFTVWSNVFDRAGLKSGETLLVHGGSSGIGVTAIQLAKAFDATVLACPDGIRPTCR